MFIDLHTHSNKSDGSLSPEQLIDYAKSKNLYAIALTDHDTVNGLKAAEKHASECGIEFIPGIEISGMWENGDLHILGYFIDPDNEILQLGLEKLKEARNNRNPQIIKKLNELGINITMQDVINKAGGNIISRAHIARALAEKKAVSSYEEAFEKFLEPGKPAYFPKDKMGAENSVNLIKKAGGLVVLAHPFSLNRTEEELTNIIKNFKEIGFDGIEAMHSYHTDEQSDFLIKLSNKLDMFYTGGSDFHDVKQKGVDMGCVKVPYSCLESMKNHHR